jgi:hypothetical protein
MVELKIFLMKNAQIVHKFAKGQSPKFNNYLEDKYMGSKIKGIVKHAQAFSG